MNSKSHVEDLHWEVLIKSELDEVMDPNAVAESSNIPKFGNGHKTCCHPCFHPKGTSEGRPKTAATLDSSIPETMLLQLPIADNWLSHLNGQPVRHGG